MNAAMTPRRKRWYRPRNVLLVLATALLIPLGWASREVWQVYTAVVNPSVDYRAELRKLSEEAAGVSSAAADDTWFLLLDLLEDAEAVRTDVEAQIAIEGFEPRDEYDDGTIDYSLVLYGRSLPDDISRERRAFAMLRERGVFDRFDRFARGPPGLKPPTGDGPLFLDLHLTEFGQARALARARAASMRVALADGDLSEVAASVEQLLALARTLSYEPQLLGYLTALAIRALALGELRYELMEAEFDAATCRSLLGAMNRHAVLAPLELPLEAERIHFYDNLQWSFSDDGRGNGYLISFPVDYLPVSVPTANRSIFDAVSSRFFYPSRAEFAGLFDEMIDGFLERSRLRLPDRANSSFHPDTFEATLSRRHALIRIPLPSFETSIEKEPTRRVLVEGTRLMVALETYHAMHARYPSTLDQLAPDILPELPRDPLHGEPFGYRLVTDDPRGRPYLLYSIGLDQIDDGGTVPPIAAAAYLAIQEPRIAGFDFVINQPRREWDE